MLLILYEEFFWDKNSRNPQGAVQRKQFLKPVELNDIPAASSDCDVFLAQRYGWQHDEACLNNDKLKAGFVSLEELKLPEINVVKENSSFRIRWFDDYQGQIRRRGFNEDFGKKGKPLAGNPDTLNVTAFVLKEGEAGTVSWNNRFVYDDDSWCFKQYQAYFVNTEKIDKNVFMREYDYEYRQIANLRYYFRY